MASYRAIDGCPIDARLAPYVDMILKRAGQSANSIYRGSAAAAAQILHAHGKHTQAELYATLPPGVADRPGTSTHELRSDGVAYAGPSGRKLAWWQQGIDSGANDSASRRAIDAAAAHYGWAVFHPYAAGVEGHHWNFKRRPRPHGLKQLREIIKLRRELPKR